MTIHNLFLGIGVMALLSNVIFWILIMSALDRRGYKTNIVLSRLHFFKYMSAYREATRKETGKTGLLFYLWLGSIWVMAVALLLAVFGP